MSDSEVPSGLDVELRKRIQHWRDIVKVQPNTKARVAAMLDVIDEALAASGEGPGRAVVDAANDVRQSHAPNEWDTCVACRKTWPCDAELLAELVLTLAATAAPAAGVAPPDRDTLDVRRLAAAAQNHETSGIHGPLHCSLACGATLAVEYARLAAITAPAAEEQG